MNKPNNSHDSTVIMLKTKTKHQQNCTHLFNIMASSWAYLFVLRIHIYPLGFIEMDDRDGT